ncbi:MAG: asparagine synthase (glutamine-hydrolyzing) [Acidobacteriota bacterium]
MCGIAGFWTPERAVDNGLPTLRRMTTAISHRGPDADGHWSDEAAGMFLGHRRLSIIDLSAAGHQPMISIGGRYVISYNGEIYNFGELRSELEAHAVRFRGHSDTEVLLAAIERWGLVAALQKSAGMFAIALWDRRERTLTLARDRIGEKPLYYGWSGRSFLFGSELKALRQHPDWRAEIDRAAIAVYLRHSYIPAPHSIYAGVRKVVPGTIVVVGPGRQLREQRYWSMAEAAEHGTSNPLAISETEAASELERLLQRTIRQQMVADVPLGAFLSGGVDSSLVVAMMQAASTRPVKTFTMKFDEAGYDESAHARAVAGHLETEHTELTVTPADALAAIPLLPEVYDEPFSDSSQVPTLLVSKLARQHVTVSLSGDGGDEFFGGYPRYAHIIGLWRKLRWTPYPVRLLCARALQAVPVSRWDAMLGCLPASSWAHTVANGERLHRLAAILPFASLEGIYRRGVGHRAGAEAVSLRSRADVTRLIWEEEYPAIRHPLHRLMYQDSVNYLPDDILTKLDRAAMATGLETRAPFVDHRMVEFAWRIPAPFNYQNGRGKRLLRQVLDRFVPAAIIERPKMGFSIPLDEWLRGPLRDWADTLLGEVRLKREGFFDVAAVREQWSQHQQGRRHRHCLLWDVLMFQAWLERQ